MAWRKTPFEKPKVSGAKKCHRRFWRAALSVEYTCVIVHNSPSLSSYGQGLSMEEGRTVDRPRDRNCFCRGPGRKLPDLLIFERRKYMDSSQRFTVSRPSFVDGAALAPQRLHACPTLCIASIFRSARRHRADRCDRRLRAHCDAAASAGTRRLDRSRCRRSFRRAWGC